MVVCATRSITGRGSRRYSTRRAKPTTPPCEDVAIHTPVRSAPSAIGCSESLSPCSKTTRSTTLRNDALDPHLHPSRKSRGTLDQRWGVHPLERADVERVLRAAVARALALELAVRFLIGLGFLERGELRLTEHQPLLRALRLQGLEPLLHAFQIVALPHAAYPGR